LPKGEEFVTTLSKISKSQSLGFEIDGRSDTNKKDPNKDKASDFKNFAEMDDDAPVVTNAILADDYPQKDSEQQQQGNFELYVQNLSYQPSQQMESIEIIRDRLNWLQLGWLIPSLKETKTKTLRETILQRVHFTANGGELVGIIGSRHERFELIQLLVGRKRSGLFDGNIFLSGPDLPKNSYYYDNVAYVQSVSFFSFVEFVD
jgi:ABC-type uncharacterized transport system ATPase subunit